MHKLIILGPEDFTTSLWPGGSTTQLFIHPPGASYAERHFDFRLSTATVQVETSVFTPLPGFSRKLLILEGAVTLAHEGHYTLPLNALDTDAFEGSWHTTSKGTCTDFNLMTSGAFEGRLSAVRLNASEPQIFCPETGVEWIFFYAYGGDLCFTLDKKNILLKDKHLFCVQGADNENIIISGDTPVTLVKALVFRK